MMIMLMMMKRGKMSRADNCADHCNQHGNVDDDGDDDDDDDVE